LSVNPSVTYWIAALKAGDADAAQRLWDGYFQRLVALARGHLGEVAHGGADGDDVAQSVFKSLCFGAEQGRFPQVTDRDDLWTLLISMTAHKSRDLIRRERAQKRGGGRVLNETALAASQEPLGNIEEIVGAEPTPHFVAQVAEQCELLLSRLNEVERRTAEMKLQGFRNREIADRMACGLRTVERRLAAVRCTWTTRE
jgi:DNA-directed RNA polymerase specialized sigma24 family protein